jgi:hypothetical protein
MPGQPTPHNPLHAAARETMQVARETKSPWFEKVAIITMIASALTTTAIAALQAVHMLRRDLEKDKERERQRAPSLPPPERPRHGGAATAGMYPDRDGDEQRRWTRREEHAEAAAPGRQR